MSISNGERIMEILREALDLVQDVEGEDDCSNFLAGECCNNLTMGYCCVNGSYCYDDNPNAGFCCNNAQPR